MARTDGIIQSANRAWRLLQATGFMDISRGLDTESWQRNVAEAGRELGEAASSLVASDNRDAYHELSHDQRITLWKAILAARQTRIGIRIISELGFRYRRMQDDVSEAERELASRANGFPVRELRAIGARIRAASPDPATVVERAAAEAGDPAPRGVTNEEAQLYQRVMLRAMQLSDREIAGVRNPGEAALGAFGASLLPPSDASGFAQNYAEDQAVGAAFGARANVIGVIISALRAVFDGAEAYRRATDDEHRLNYWIGQVCLQESHNNPDAALRLRRNLQDILERMNAWLAWLQRHTDHPSYDPPGGTIRADPTASLDLTRPGSGNRTGPVMGSVRGPYDRQPYGLG